MSENLERARVRVRELIQNGEGLRKLGEMFRAQGGDPRVVEDTSLLPQAPIIEPVPSPSSGFVTGIHAQQIGFAGTALGAGRKRKGDPIDPAVGIIMEHRVGDAVEAGQPLAVVHARDRQTLAEARQILLDSIAIGPDRPAPRKLIEEIVE